MRRWLAAGGAVLLAAIAVFSVLSVKHAKGLPAPPAAAAVSRPVEASAMPLLQPADEPTPADREAKRLARYDKDGDGSVGRDEYLALRRKSFAKLDTDGDGKLSFAEYAAKASGKFDDADKDRSGRLSAAEFATTAAVRKAARKTVCPPTAEADN